MIRAKIGDREVREQKLGSENCEAEGWQLATETLIKESLVTKYRIRKLDIRRFRSSASA